MAEKMITLSKDNTLHAKRQVLAYVTKEDVAKKLFDEIGPKYADRNGGYTRILKLGVRRGDAAELCILQLVKEQLEPKAEKKEAAPKAEEVKAEPKAEEAKAEEPKAEEAKAE